MGRQILKTTLADPPIGRQISKTTLADPPMGRQISKTTLADPLIGCQISKTTLADPPIGHFAHIPTNYAAFRNERRGEDGLRHYGLHSNLFESLSHHYTKQGASILHIQYRPNTHNYRDYLHQQP